MWFLVLNSRYTWIFAEIINIHDLNYRIHNSKKNYYIIKFISNQNLWGLTINYKIKNNYFN